MYFLVERHKYNLMPCGSCSHCVIRTHFPRFIANRIRLWTRQNLLRCPQSVPKPHLLLLRLDRASVRRIRLPLAPFYLPARRGFKRGFQAPLGLSGPYLMRSDSLHGTLSVHGKRLGEWRRPSFLRVQLAVFPLKKFKLPVHQQNLPVFLLKLVEEFTLAQHHPAISTAFRSP
jgi:hypothetical protein